MRRPAILSGSCFLALLAGAPVAAETGASSAVTVIDVRIRGHERSVSVRSLPAAVPGSDGTGRNGEASGIRHIRLAGDGAAGAPAADVEHAQLPRGYDPGQDPYVQYPELSDPAHYQQ